MALSAREALRLASLRCAEQRLCLTRAFPGGRCFTEVHLSRLALCVNALKGHALLTEVGNTLEGGDRLLMEP